MHWAKQGTLMSLKVGDGEFKPINLHAISFVEWHLFWRSCSKNTRGSIRVEGEGVVVLIFGLFSRNWTLNSTDFNQIEFPALHATSNFANPRRTSHSTPDLNSCPEPSNLFRGHFQHWSHPSWESASEISSWNQGKQRSTDTRCSPFTLHAHSLQSRWSSAIQTLNRKNDFKSSQSLVSELFIEYHNDSLVPNKTLSPTITVFADPLFCCAPRVSKTASRFETCLTDRQMTHYPITSVKPITFPENILW